MMDSSSLAMWILQASGVCAVKYKASHPESPIAPKDGDKRTSLELKDIVRNVLEEARMVLPGIQALFGFQLIAVFNNTFSGLSAPDRLIHLVALLLTIVSIGCLLGTASYHRQVEQNSVSQHLVNIASKLLYVGMAPLVLSICLDTYVVCNIIMGDTIKALMVSTGSFLWLAGFWYVWPWIARKRRTPAP